MDRGFLLSYGGFATLVFGQLFLGQISLRKIFLVFGKIRKIFELYFANLAAPIDLQEDHLGVGSPEDERSTRTRVLLSDSAMMTPLAVRLPMTLTNIPTLTSSGASPGGAISTSGFFFLLLFLVKQRKLVSYINGKVEVDGYGKVLEWMVYKQNT